MTIYSPPKSATRATATPTTWQRIVAFLTGPYPTLLSRFVLGGILFLAGLTKLGVATTMKQSILAYDMNLPPFVVTSWQPPCPS